MPPMTARTQQNVDKLDDLAAFAGIRYVHSCGACVHNEEPYWVLDSHLTEGLSPRESDGLEQVLDPEKAT